MKEGQSLGNFDISINTHSQTGFTSDSQFGGLLSVYISSLFTGGIIGDHTFIINDPGDLSPDSPSPGDVSAIASEKLTDIFVYLEYGIS